MKFKKPETDLSKFNVNDNDLEIKYGLPKNVQFCQSCAISNQKPTSAVEYKHTAKSKKETVEFDDEGICSACQVAEIKKTIDWNEREKQLQELCDKFRSKDGSYDCLVPGSGGKDSFYTAHILKYKYGMNPLTVTWAPHEYTDWGWRNMQKWIHSGFDNVLHTPNGKVHRLLTRLAVENLFHPFQPFFYGQKALAPKMASQYNISLIFYGENEAEYGNKVDTFKNPNQDRKYFAQDWNDDLFLGGVSVGDLKSEYGLTEHDLLPYKPADPEILQNNDINVHYLGYYLPWHPQSCYYYAVEHMDFETCPERNPGTFSKYASLDDKIDDLNFYTTYIKFGIGRCTYDVSQEIRSGDLTREEGVALVKRFDGEYPERFENDLFKYLSITEKEFGEVAKKFEHQVFNKEYFMALCDKFRSPHLWENIEGKWQLRKTVWNSEKISNTADFSWKQEGESKWSKDI
jgi:N-acetyl sugar amidotransferase